MKHQRIFTSREAARFLKCNPRTLENPGWRRVHGLPAVRIGRAVRFLEDDLLEFVKGHREVIVPEGAYPGRWESLLEGGSG